MRRRPNESLFRLARRGQRGKIGHRSAADKEAACFGREPKNLTDPIDGHAFEFDRRRRRTPDGEIGVQSRSKQIGERTDWRPGRLHVAKHPGMRVLPAKWNDGFAKNFQQRIKIRSLNRKLRVEPVSDLA